MSSGCIRQTDLPHASRLFADLVYEFDRVGRFYPHQPLREESLRAAAAQIHFPPESRERLVRALSRQNEGSPLLDSLARQGTVAVVTGQQAGLLGGPAYTIYKALTAVRLARRLCEAGIDAVPVFWLATEDHDFAEVNHCWVFGADQTPVRLAIEGGSAGRTVGPIVIEAAVADQLRRIIGDLPFAEEVARLAEAAYAPGRSMGAAFSGLLKLLLGRFEVLTLDPLAPEIRELAAPALAQSLRRIPELVERLLNRGLELRERGYHAQVHVEPDSSLMFLLDGDRRRPLRRRDGRYWAGDQSFAEDELVERASSLSPNAILRPVIQDHILPTAAYVGGPAELAYMAQSEVLYASLLGRMPVIAPRAFFTLLDSRAAKVSGRYGLSVADCFHGLEALREKIARALTPPELKAEFAAASGATGRAVDRLRGHVSRFDPTLAEALDRSRARILYQLSKIEKKSTRESLRRDERAGRDAAYFLNLVYPNKHPQERLYSFLPLAARHGLDLIGRLYESIHLDSPDHIVLQV